MPAHRPNRISGETTLVMRLTWFGNARAGCMLWNSGPLPRGGRSAGRLGFGGSVGSGRGGPSYSGLRLVFCRRPLRRPIFSGAGTGPVRAAEGPPTAGFDWLFVGGRSAGRLGFGGSVGSGHGGPSYSGLRLAFCRRPLCRPMGLGRSGPGWFRSVGPRRALLQRALLCRWNGLAPSRPSPSFCRRPLCRPMGLGGCSGRAV